LSYRR